MERLRIAQLSDLHLGANLSGGKLALPQAKADKRRAEQRQCLSRFATHVRETRPDVVLMPGDLFDGVEPDVDDLNFVISTVNAMAPVPVFIAPGNHDGFSPSSGYNVHSALYQSRGGGPKWASHVRLFTGEQFETVAVPYLQGLTVTGAAFHRHMPETHRALAEVPRAARNGVRLLLFHGSLKNYPHQGDDKEVLPIAAAELESLGFAYAAVGHYHRGGPITGTSGRVLGAYAGAPFGLSLSDRGAGAWLEAGWNPAEPLRANALHWHRCDDRAIHQFEVDVTGATDTTALAGRVEEQLAAQHAGARDIVHVVLRGRLARGVDFACSQALAERFFHVAVDDSAVEPDYAADFASPLPEEPGLAATSEEVFRWKMLKLYHEAPSDAERARIKEALYYGLDALTLGEIHLR